MLHVILTESPGFPQGKAGDHTAEPCSRKCLQHLLSDTHPREKAAGLCIIISGDAVLENCHWLFWQMPCFYSVSSESGQIKPRPENGAFQRRCQTSHIMTILCEWDFLKSSKPILPLPVVTKLLIFATTMVVKLLFFKATLERGEGNGARAS